MNNSARVCRHHPAVHAQFRCTGCSTYFCADCITWKKNPYIFNDIAFMCPRCAIEAEVLGIGHLIEPFWRRLPHFLSYPFRSGPLALLLLSGIILGGLHYLLADQIISLYFSFIPAYLLCLFIVLLYCREVFHHTVAGDFRTVSIGLTRDAGGWNAARQGVLFLVVLGSGYALVDRLGPTPGGLAWEVLKIPAPAIFILLLMNDSLLSALNPLYIFLLMSRVGGRYWLLFCFTSLLFSTILWAALAISRSGLGDGLVGLIFFYTLHTYCLIVTYYLLGYFVLQYHEALRLPVNYATFIRLNSSSEMARRSGTDPLANDARLLLAEGKPEEALALIREHDRGEFRTAEIALLYLKLIDFLGEQDRLQTAGAPLIQTLLKQGRTPEGVALYQRCLTEFKDFIATPDALYQLFEWFFKQRNYPDAVRCANQFTEAAPHDHRAPALTLKGAALAVQHLQDTSQARVFVRRFLRNYPGHKQSGEAEAIARWLNRAAASEKN